MADDEHLTFDTSPSGASSVEFTWLIPDSGAFGRDRTVPRSQATHARIVETGGANPGSKVVPQIEAIDYAATIERFIAERDATHTTRSREWQNWVGTLVSQCGRCGAARQYVGFRRFQLAGAVLGTAHFHIYACPHCGSLEQFIDGIVPHPLAGNRPASQTS